jgi:hypothetical protein
MSRSFTESAVEEATLDLLEGVGWSVLRGAEIAPGERGQLPRGYVGEGDAVAARLDHHVRNKEFWTHAAGFTSKDQNLNKAHVQYLEARLVQLAGEAKRCELDNGNVPQLPALSAASD